MIIMSQLTVDPGVYRLLAGSEPVPGLCDIPEKIIYQSSSAKLHMFSALGIFVDEQSGSVAVLPFEISLPPIFFRVYDLNT